MIELVSNRALVICIVVGLLLPGATVLSIVKIDTLQLVPVLNDVFGYGGFTLGVVALCTVPVAVFVWTRRRRSPMWVGIVAGLMSFAWNAAACFFLLLMADMNHGFFGGGLSHTIDLSTGDRFYVYADDCWDDCQPPVLWRRVGLRRVEVQSLGGGYSGHRVEGRFLIVETTLGEVRVDLAPR